MTIVFNGTTLNWYDSTIIKDGVTVNSPTNAGEVFFGATKVFGLSGTSFTSLYAFGLAPSSLALETAVSYLIANHADAFSNYYYDIGPGGTGDSRWRYSLNPGYRMVTSDGTFTGAGGPHYLWEGRTVTGANTSHNGGTSCDLQQDNGV